MPNERAERLDNLIERVLDGHEPTVDEAVALLNAEGEWLYRVVSAADELRRRRVGDVVTYVVNRNINFTNVCIKRCGFCAFSRDFRQDEGYFLPIEEIVRRAKEAAEWGATEVCIQAGLPPKMEGDLYVRLTRAIKEAVPELHIHGFSPEEVLYGAVRSSSTVREYLTRLKEAGVGSLPGTSAEILDQDLRDRIAPGRISVDRWVEVIRTAHELGIPTTATIMYGHVESERDRARHLSLIREIQKETGGFTEFVPLSFVASEAPMYRHGTVDGVRSGASRDEVLKMHAVARLMLDAWIPNLQVSWVKEGLPMSEELLAAGVNDMGGTLINESISTSAGASHGQRVSPRALKALIRRAGRRPAERDTRYRIRKYSAPDDAAEPLDDVGDDVDERFGSYGDLVRSEQFRFRPRSTT
jgi:7,8-didemethyl-8-hydroxy-5-deazariboflavin synthase CofH subunit